MVRIFKNNGKSGNGEFAIQTTCLDADSFISDLAEALPEALKSQKDDEQFAALEILQKAMPIAFKLSGYKADTVIEQRTLVSGVIPPDHSEIVATAGR